MDSSSRSYCVAYASVLIFLTSLIVAAADITESSKYCACDKALINRIGFPNGFVFGTSSSAYQTEGAYDANGKGPSMWDNFTHTYPERIRDHSNGNVAADSYHHYKEDVKLLKNMGMDAYKFSISWPRILPGGSISKGVNQDGINYYNNVINELLANGIQPWVTILHIDGPQALEDTYGGFLSSEMVSDFVDFAELLFKEFGDRVKHWVTINEPWCLSYFGYTIGIGPPGRCSDGLEKSKCLESGNSATEPYIITHNQLLAHAAAVKLYRDKYQKGQKGKIGITVNSMWFIPYNETQENKRARDRAFDFMMGWVLEPLTSGQYPKTMRARVGDRLPEFSEEEARKIKGSFDFIGINYYSAQYVLSIDNSTNMISSYIADAAYITTGVKNGIKLGEQGSSYSSYNAYPKGLRHILHYMKETYNDPLIYITENGLDEDNNETLPISEALKDYKRQKYFLDHLCCLHEAIEQDNANVKGYFTWSLADNFQWGLGYLTRYGLNYVDFKSKLLTRYPKYSARWFGQILAPKGRQVAGVVAAI